MLRITPDDLLHYAKSIEDQELKTIKGKKFTVKVDGEVLTFTPTATKKPRVQDRKFMQKVCEAFSKKKSLKPGDYREVTHNASYTLVLISHCVESKTAAPPQLPDVVWRAIKQRRGQSEFRAELIRAYDGRCAVTDCDAVAALEAAHITGYSEAGSQDVNNGLLLRADIHTLFDCDLIRIHPTKRTVVLAEELVGTIYSNLDGKTLRPPAASSDKPSTQALQCRWARIQSGL